MRLSWMLGLCTLLLAPQPDIVGVWVLRNDQISVRFEARADGTFTQTLQSAEGTQTYTGSFTLKDGLLTLTTDDGDVMQLHAKVTEGTLAVTDDEGNGFELARAPADEPAETPAGGEEPVPLPAGGPGDLVPQLALAPAAGGHIVYTRVVPQQLVAAGTPVTLTPTKLFVMAGDGSGQAPYLLGDPETALREPRWGGDYTRLVFTSDFHPERSALQSDLFVMSADGTPAMRVTGNELRGPAPKGYGTIIGIVIDSAGAIIAGEEQMLQAINLTAQGAEMVCHPGQAPPGMPPEISQALRGQPRTFVIPHVAAGNNVWVKIWVNQNVGRVFTCAVEPGEITDLGKVPINEAVYLAKKPSITPDGRFVVGAAVGNTVDQASLSRTGGLGRTGGSANITVYETATGRPVATVAGEQIGASSLVGPVLSPDGRTIACAAGQPTMENLILLDLADVLAGTPRFRPVVAGERVLPSPQTGGRAFLVGCGSIAWSPDGQRLAFCRSWVSEDWTGDLWLVNADGSGPTQLTHVAPNQMALNPCFSPDGRSLAFTLITGGPNGLKTEHLMQRQYVSDIYTMGLNGSAPRQLTTDGLSAEPAWGR